MSSNGEENGNPRRPAILLTWDGAGQVDVAALIYELRLLGGTQVVTGSTLSVDTGSLVILPGILPDTIYEVRARFVAPRPMTWTAWNTVTTPQDFISPSDFGSQLDLWFADAGISVPRLVNTLPPNNASRVDDEWVYLIPAKKLYRWSQAVGDWIAVVDPDDIPDGSITGPKIGFATLVAGLFAAGAIKAGDIDIDGTLRLDATGAGFSIGKSDAADTDNTGLYVGRRVAPGGGTGFGFLLGTKSPSNVERTLEASDDLGLRAVNMEFGLQANVSLGALFYATSQTIALPAGTKSITMTLLGGGGGPSNGGAGGLTRVQLYSNGAPTGVEWTSAGGTAGGAGGLYGQASVMGAGGTPGGRSRNTIPSSGGPNYTYTNYAGTTAVGYGAGAGGYSDPYASPAVTRTGGRAAAPTNVVGYDVSSYPNPSLVITIGAAGSSPYAWKAKAGVVTLKTFSSGVVPAGVIPFEPTATGSFARAASQTGPAVFPNFGTQKGLWVLSTSSGAALDMNIEIDTVGTVVVTGSAATASFVASKRPNITFSGATAKTILYAFYRMSVEG